MKLNSRYEDNVSFLKEEIGVGASFDAVCREFRIGGKPAALFFINGLADSDPATEILKRLMLLDREQILPDTLDRIMEEGIPHFQVQAVETFDEVIGNLMSGLGALIVEGVSRAIIVDIRKYPARQPEEPDIERVVRGSRDGFTETLLVNTALIRRRVRDPKLRTEMLQVGKRSKSDICLCYLKDVANPDLIDFIRGRLEEIKIDGLPMAEKSVEELIAPGSFWNPLPKVRYTERPDVAAIHLLEGHVLIVVDTSPSIMIAPTTLFHHLQHAEEYRQSPTPGAYLRWIRFFAIVLSLFLGPLWLLGALNPTLLPQPLAFIGPQESAPVPLLMQFIIAELAIDLMRFGALHTPTPLTTALGVVAAVLVGQLAVEVKLLTNEVILYTAIAAVATFSTPSFELAMANRLARIFLLLSVGFFKLPGLLFGLLVLFVFYSTTRSFGVPYLWPLIPLDWGALKSILVRSPVPMENVRPSILKTLDPFRQVAPARKPKKSYENGGEGDAGRDKEGGAARKRSRIKKTGMDDKTEGNNRGQE
ncbi:MAG: spore germination protein [Firmicutes bacterium]|nr:spore germination protein [Bacillota bacterium]